jgi:mannose/fructose-specific phosphotransferase system component IIA
MKIANNIVYILVGRESYINGIYEASKEIYPEFRVRLELVYISSNCVERLKEMVENYAKEDINCLIFVDFFDDYAKKIAQSLSTFQNVEILSGVNLPMLIYAITKAPYVFDFRKFVKELVNSGKKSIIRLAGKML